MDRSRSRLRTPRRHAHPRPAEGDLNGLVLGIGGYVLLQIAIGVAVSRRIRTEDDYLLAGRSLGPVLATFTIFATWFGAETCIAAAGSVYARGIAGGSADPFGYGLCVILMGLLLAVPLWRLKLTTAGDLFRRRFSPGVERLAVLLMVPTSVFWAAAQIRAFGQVLSAASGLEVSLAIALAALVVIFYTMIGGLLAVAWTDFVQGVVLIVGLLILGVVFFRSLGPGALAEVEPERLRLFGGSDRPLFEVLEDWAIPVLGSLTAAELVARVIACRTPGIARGATVAGGSLFLVVGLIPVYIGLLASSLVPGLDHPEQVLPLVAQQVLPTAMYAIFAGALVSAILSTVDSALLVAGSLTSHNLIVPLLSDVSESAKVRLARGAVVVFGLLAWYMAARAGAVYELVETASAFGSAGIVTVFVFGLFTRVGGPLAAQTSLLAGAGAWILGAYVVDLPYPYLTSLGVALGTYLLTSLLRRAD